VTVEVVVVTLPLSVRVSSTVLVEVLVVVVAVPLMVRVSSSVLVEVLVMVFGAFPTVTKRLAETRIPVMIIAEAIAR